VSPSPSTVLVGASVLVAVTAAVRSTWSPCGLSMLSTITPFGERARGHRYGATSAWFVVGAALGGLALGAVAAGTAFLVAAVGVSAVVLGGIGLGTTLVVLVSDTGLAGHRLPVHHRQVNERWLDAYRPWVYGAGFGCQIGCGLATYVTTAAVYLTVVLAGLSGRSGAALAVGVAFGLVRGAAVLLTRRVGTPAALLAFHQRFTAWRPWADRAVGASLAASAAALAWAVGALPATAVAGTVAVGAVVLRAAWPARVATVSPIGRRTPDGGPGAPSEGSVAVG
jgi:MFS family permease